MVELVSMVLLILCVFVHLGFLVEHAQKESILVKVHPYVLIMELVVRTMISNPMDIRANAYLVLLVKCVKLMLMIVSPNHVIMDDV